MAKRTSTDTLDEFLSLLDEYVEDGPGAVQPLFCPRSSCNHEILDYDTLDGHYECPICGFRVEPGEADQYLQDILDGKYEDY